MRRFLPDFREDLLWAGYLVILAVFFGLATHWSLVSLAFRGELPEYLEKLRQERRAREFKAIPVVTLEQAFRLWEQGETLFLDVRRPEEFAELHIPRALNVPEEILEDDRALEKTGLLGLPRERQILVYCSTRRCDASLRAARRLRALGFVRVFAFLGGFQAWDEAGYEVASLR